MSRALSALCVVAGCLVGLAETVNTQNRRPLIIDMHLHAETLAGFLGDIAGARPRPPKVCAGDQEISYPGWDPRKQLAIGEARSCRNILAAPGSDEELLRQTLEMLERYNIRAVTSGSLDDVGRWRAAAPDRIIPAVNFERGHDARGGALYREPVELRRLFAEGKFAVFAEVGPQYHGLSPADPALEPYFALAEELDIPIGLHLGEGPPGGMHVGYRQYRVAVGRPLLLEEVLVRHPKLRIYVMHFGSPLIDEMIALLYSHPQVYVDVAQNNWGFPRKEFHRHLRRLVEAGFGKRILFGSDQMVWPQTIEIAIESIESADFLTHEQKRDILCRNAARFLRLDGTVCD
ncbi:MAG: amidohydrolase family protein [Acidobacteria bacterium]|nr:amidohydrolase family protein [Acidobacteriota bacterium]